MVCLLNFHLVISIHSMLFRTFLSEIEVLKIFTTKTCNVVWNCGKGTRLNMSDVRHINKEEQVRGLILIRQIKR